MTMAVWEWCKRIWYSSRYELTAPDGWFENDVKEYGTQAAVAAVFRSDVFENDVKEYGTQASTAPSSDRSSFENDVKEYGTQAFGRPGVDVRQFENDVKEYGTQAGKYRHAYEPCLRMM